MVKKYVNVCAHSCIHPHFLKMFRSRFAVQFSGQVLCGLFLPIAIFIMVLAMINGLITSVFLETIVLMTQKIAFRIAVSTALGMSFLSMLSMELAMNITDFVLAGGEAQIKLDYLPLILFFGFITPWPYNYWRLKALDEACH